MNRTQQIKARAKRRFAKVYRYPLVPFKSIGRECFAHAMDCARREQDAFENWSRLSPAARRHTIEAMQSQCKSLRAATNRVGARSEADEITRNISVLRAFENELTAIKHWKLEAAE